MRLLTVVTVVLGSVPVLAVPAAAATGCERPVGFTATARADLLKVGLLDVRPLGLTLPKVADLTLASTRAGMATQAASKSTASAEYLTGEVLGLALPRGPLEAKVAQQAPPHHQSPARNNALSLDLGIASAGTGDLLAQAEWSDGMTCGTQLGRAGSASAALLEAAVLPGTSGAMVRASRNLSSQSATALIARDNRAASAASAQIGLASLTLFDKITVKVLTPPQLTAVATGRAETSTVDYKSPILEISGPGIGARTLSAPGESLEIPAPASLLGNLLPGVAPTTLIRLSLGDLNKRITAQAVTASAASLRLQVLASADRSAVLDLGVGLLDVSATAPQWTDPVPVGDPGPGCGAPGCKLPLTGFNAGFAAATGILLFVLGRFLLVLSRRRTE